MLTLKTTFENDTRRRQFASNGSLANLKSVVQELYALKNGDNNVTLKYVDDDGDLITLGSELELREAVQIAEKKKQGVLRISVFRVDGNAAKPTKKEVESDNDDNEAQQQQPFAAIQSFIEGLVQGEEGTKVRTFFEQLGEQLQTQLQVGSEQVQQQAMPHVKKIRLALEELLARGVVTRDTFRDVSEAIVASPRVVQDLLLSLMAMLKEKLGAPQSFVRHAATCDGCNTPIVGVRYKCVNCADYDLCGQCEARNVDGAVHERTHAFLKLPFAVPLGIGQLLPNLRPLAGGAGAGRCAERRRRLMMCPYMQGQQQQVARHHCGGRYTHPSVTVVGEDFASYSWFKKNCTRENADAILKNADVGTFLVRPGSNETTLNLSFKDEKVGVVHASIVKTARGWQLFLGDVVTPPTATVLELVKNLEPTLKFDAAASAPATTDNNNNNNNNNDVATNSNDVVVEITSPKIDVVAAVPVAAAAAAAAAPEVVFAFARQLEQLETMGFSDESVLKALLELHNGDVLSVVQELVQ